MMFKRWYSWRLKRRRRSLALAWCGDASLADQLLAESCSGFGGSNPVDVYRHMASCWLRHVDCDDGCKTGAKDFPSDESVAPSDLTGYRVRRLIAQMPMAQRMTLSLIDVARLSYRDTASVMNIGLFEVQYHIVTARRQLLEEMEEMHADGNDTVCLLTPVSPTCRQ